MNSEKHQEFLTILHKQKELYSEKINVHNRLNNIINQLNEIENKLSQACFDAFGNHDYIEERESGMYGERFYICSRCNHMY